MEKIKCNSCGAEYDDTLSSCPYCGTINYKGAENKYMGTLDDIKENLDDLEKVPSDEMKKEIKHQGKFLAILIIILIIISLILAGLCYFVYKDTNHASTSDYVWQQTNYPKMDELYNAGKYDELVNFYYEAIDDDKDIWNYDHYEFISFYSYINDIALVKNIIETEEPDKYDYEDLLHDSLYLEWIDLRKDSFSSDDEITVLKNLYKPYDGYYQQIFNLTEDEKLDLKNQFIKNGYLDYSTLEKYTYKHFPKLKR